MSNILKLQWIALVIGVGLLSACASGPKENAKSDALAPVAASYNEKVKSVPVTQLKAAPCPSNEAAYEKLDWKAIVPLVNGCVQTKSWNMVEKMGNFLATRASLTPWGPYYLSLSAEQRGDFPRAIWMLELALKKDPNEGLFNYELGRIDWDLKDDSEALRHLRLAAEVNPSLTDAQFLMGQMAHEHQDDSQAESFFQKALANDPNHLPSLLAMASLKIKSQDYTKAEGFLTHAVSLNPSCTKNRVTLAQVQEINLKNLASALQSYKTLKQLSADKKLDESVKFNLDEKIQTLQQSLSQVGKSEQVSNRTPTGERQADK